MILTVETFEKYVGQSVKDPYGRYIGVIAGFYSEIDGTVSYVNIEFADGTFAKLPVNRFEFKPEEVVLVPEWKAEALSVKKKLEVARKRIKALDDLYAKGEIAKHAYDAFKKKLEADLGKLKIESREVRKILQNRLRQLEKQVEELEKAYASLKMVFFAGEISEPTFKRATDIVKRNIEKCDAEKKDIKSSISELEKIESTPISLPTIAKPAKEEEIPKAEEPLVVHVVEGEH